MDDVERARRSVAWLVVSTTASLATLSACTVVVGSHWVVWTAWAVWAVLAAVTAWSAAKVHRARRGRHRRPAAPSRR